MNAALSSRWLLAMLVLATGVAGCSLRGPKPRLDSAAGMFDSAEVNYRVSTDRINKLTPQLETQLVSYKTVVDASLPPNAVADVRISCPHPEKRDGFALLTVRFLAVGESQAAAPEWWKSRLLWHGPSPEERVLEVWRLDLPQNEVAGIINHLHSSGFFTSYDKPAEGAQVQTQLDGAKVSKTWRHVPELDSLIVRVRAEGRLLSSPPGDAHTLFQGLAGPTPSSVAAYRRLNAEGGAALASDRSEMPLDAAPGYRVARLPNVDANR